MTQNEIGEYKVKLFEPITIRTMKVPNRIVYPAIQLNMGLTNRRGRAFYTERARGGTGLIISANTSVDNFACEELWGGEKGLKDFVTRCRTLTDEIHSFGAKMGVQLWMDNRFPQGRGVQISGKEADPTSGDRIAPSADGEMRALTIPEIDSIIYRFAKGARNVREAGFDCVELHGAHRYLLCQFTNPDVNKRTDKYGGDMAGRMKFGLDITRAVRAFVGPDYPVLYRLGALYKGKEILPDSLVFAQELEKAGIDLLDVSTSGYGTVYPVSPVKRDKPGTLVPLAEAIKGVVKIPVIGVGKINTPEVAEDILTKGRTDMVAIGRQLIADPFWPKKVQEGRFKDVVACESCNVNCYAPTFERKVPPGAPICKHNPRVGKEHEIPAPE